MDFHHIDYNEFLNRASSSEDVLFDEDRTTLIKYSIGEKGGYAIPDTVVTVKHFAFCNCENLTGLSIPQETIVFELDFDTFCGCDQLTDIIVHEDNPVYSSIDGVLFNKDGTVLLRYPPGKENTDYVILENTVRIGHTAFWDCEWLTNIVLPKSLKFIGESIIENCSRLKTIKLLRETMILNWILDRLSRQLVYLD
jgi:hypothetical protein